MTATADPVAPAAPAVPQDPALSLLLPAQPDAAAAWTTLGELAARDDLPPFGALQRDFAQALSRTLLGHAEARRHPALVALGFWLRPAHLGRLVDAAQTAASRQLLRPRGLVLHLAPGNVDTLFAYSWVLSLLCGNRSVVRLSSRDSAATQALLTVLDGLLAQPDWAPIAQRVVVLRYGHDDAVTQRLSALCDMRVVWGGDATVRHVRAIALPPHATELCFGDKFSLTLLQAARVAAGDGAALSALAQAFVRDAYTFGQQACSSPRLLLWQGDGAAIAAARARFWPAVETAARAFDHGLGASDFLNSAVAADLLALQAEVRIEPGPALLRRVWLQQPAVHASAHCGGGLFHEAGVVSLDELLPLLDRRVQTVAHHGFDREVLLAWVRAAALRGIDRLVPVGEALEFAPVWDGIDLWRAFTREVDLRW